jgi:ABC-type multidrug transport system permease subunit
MPREEMPEQMQRISLLTPHAWALKAYQELLISAPDLNSVFADCGFLAAFGIVFTGLAWWWMRLD